MGRWKKLLAVLLTSALLLTQLPCLLSAADLSESADPLAEAKQQLGCPYPEGVNVLLGEEYLTFSAAPELRNQRVWVPAEEFLKALGASVTWQEEGEGGEAVFADGSRLSFTVDAKGMMPLYQTLAAADYTAIWDGTYDVVILYQPETLMEEIDSRFRVMNSLLAASAAQTDLSKTYAVDFLIDAELAPDQEEEELSPMALQADLEGLVQGLNVALEGRLSLDLGFLEEALFGMTAITGEVASGEEAATPETETTEMVLAGLKDFDLSVIANAEENVIYMKSDALAAMAPEELEEGSWLLTSYDANASMALLEELYGKEFENLKDLTMGRLLVEASATDAVSWQALDLTVDLCELLMGDKYMYQRFADGNATYVLEYDKASFARALLSSAFAEELLASEELTLADIREAMDFFQDFGYRLEFRQEGDRVVYSAMDFRLAVGNEESAVVLDYHQEGTDTDSQGSLLCEIQDFGTITLNFDSAQWESDAQVPAAPPAGEKILDMR